MTHTLHRTGPLDSLEHDFVMHSMPARNFNHEGATPKLQGFLKSAQKHHAVNYGDGKRGNRFFLEYEDMYANVATITHAVFTEQDDVKDVLRDVKAGDYGMSITMSGLFEKLFECCAEVGLHPHAIEHSLGVLGNTEKLPETEVSQITTMCGHAQVARGLVYRLIRKIKKGELTPEEAGVELAKPCGCGVFNPVRAARLIEEYCALYHVSQR